RETFAIRVVPDDSEADRLVRPEALTMSPDVGYPVSCTGAILRRRSYSDRSQHSHILTPCGSQNHRDIARPCSCVSLKHAPELIGSCCVGFGFRTEKLFQLYPFFNVDHEPNEPSPRGQCTAAFVKEASSGVGGRDSLIAFGVVIKHRPNDVRRN